MTGCEHRHSHDTPPGGDLPLHPLLRAIDAVAMYDSTVGREEVLMHAR